MIHAAVDARACAVRDRAAESLRSRVMPSGAMRGVDALRWLRRVPAALALTGHVAEAWRVLDALLASPAAALPGEGRVEADDLDDVILVGESALRCGRVVEAARCHELAQRAWVSRTWVHAGASHGAVEVRAPRAEAHHEGAIDLRLTARAGSLAAALGVGAVAGRAQAALDAHLAEQPHPDALLLRRDARGALITAWPAEEARLHVIHTAAHGPGHGALGELVALFAEQSLARPDVAEAALDRASQALDFAARCAPRIQHADDAAALADGVGWYLRACARARREVSPWVYDLLKTCVDVVVLRADLLRVDDGEGVDRAASMVAHLQGLFARVDLADAPRATPAQEGYRVLLCNAPPEAAAAIAEVLVRERLAACVNAVSGVQSTYNWEGSIERDREVTLLIKTAARRVDEVTLRIRALHPYALPEVIALPVQPREGHAPYLDWIDAQTATLNE